MKLSIKGLSIALAVIWGGAILVTGLLFVWNGTYGEEFLTVCSSIYPGFTVEPSVSAVLIGTVYGLVDGAVCGAVFAFVYNRFVSDS